MKNKNSLAVHGMPAIKFNAVLCVRAEEVLWYMVQQPRTTMMMMTIIVTHSVCSAYTKTSMLS